MSRHPNVPSPHRQYVSSLFRNTTDQMGALRFWEANRRVNQKLDGQENKISILDAKMKSLCSGLFMSVNRVEMPV